MEPSTIARPIQPGERIEVIDALRGIALFGILVVNITHFFSWEPSHSIDRPVARLVELLAQNKFYPLFSFLFGVGFATQMSRASGPNLPRYVRRLGALFAIGIVHYLLLARYDILMQYAMLGLLLPLFRKSSQRTLLVFAAFLVVFGSVERQLWVKYVNWRSRDSAVGQSLRAERAAGQQRERHFAEVQDRGSFVEGVQARWHRLPSFLSQGIRSPGLPQILAMFLLGLLAWSQGILVHPGDHARLLQVLVWAGGAVGIVVNLKSTWAPALIQHGTLDRLARNISDPALTAFYIAVVLLLWERFQTRATFLATTGRMALTNYLLQSVAMSLLFCGYGLHIKIHSALSLVFALGIYGANVLISIAWLRSYRFGPMEWVWRFFTYGCFWQTAPLARAKATHA